MIIRKIDWYLGELLIFNLRGNCITCCKTCIFYYYGRLILLMTWLVEGSLFLELPLSSKCLLWQLRKFHNFTVLRPCDNCGFLDIYLFFWSTRSVNQISFCYFCMRIYSRKLIFFFILPIYYIHYILSQN